MASLPSPRYLVASLISSISTTSTANPSTTTEEDRTGNPLKDAPPETQKALLTLHVLFPNELLPALDLLDRGLVTRFVLASQPGHQTTPDQRRSTVAYYVRSAQPQQSRHYRSAEVAEHIASYEVRLGSWNCSCPAFAFAAFPANAPAPETASGPAVEVSNRHREVRDVGVRGNWAFGGLTNGNDMPVCKHILACVLIERCAFFKPFAVEQEVSIEELAGWAAGWVD